MPKTLYVSDLDGTLLRGDIRISDYSLKILTELTARGVAITYATARSIISAAPALCGFTPSVPAILHNGVFIIDPATREVRSACIFTEAMTAKARDAFTAHGMYPLVYSHDARGEHVSWLVGYENEGVQRYLDGHVGDPRLREARSLDALYGGDVHYITCIGNDEELEPLQKLFMRDSAFKCYYGKDLYSEEYWCELTDASATKASAILRVKEMLGFERVVCFGDAINDMPMFEIANECYAVENAVPELKAIATGVISSNEEDGVARWLWENL